jgi:hypothetical protein
MQIPRVLWIAFIVLLIFGIAVILWDVQGYSSDNSTAELQDYFINLKSERAGIILSTAFAVLLLILTLVVESNLRQQSLNGARFLFLRTDVESYKEALIQYIDLFRLGNGLTGNLSQTSWESFDKKFWPKEDTIKQITTGLRNHDLSGTYTVRTINLAINDLWAALEKIVIASGTNIFEGKEHLARRALFSAYYGLGLLRSKVPALSSGKNHYDQIDLSNLGPSIKLCAETCSKVLEDMAKLASSIKTKQ